MRTAVQLLNARVLSRIKDDQLYIRIEANERTAALLFALGVPYTFVDPREDSGSAWYEFQATNEMIDDLKVLVDFIGAVMYSAPQFGQMLLTGDHSDA